MTVASIDEQGLTLQSGERFAADFIVVGIGVRHLTALADQACLAIDRGITSMSICKRAHSAFPLQEISRAGLID